MVIGTEPNALASMLARRGNAPLRLPSPAQRAGSHPAINRQGPWPANLPDTIGAVPAPHIHGIRASNRWTRATS
jgi:hypothetical protein